MLRPTELVDEPPTAQSEGLRSLILLQGDSGERAPLPGKISLPDVVDICIDAAIGEGTLSRSSVIISSIKNKSEGSSRPNSWDLLIPKVKTITLQYFDIYD